MVEQLTLNQLVEGSSPSRCNCKTKAGPPTGFFALGRPTRPACNPLRDVEPQARRGRVAELADALDLGSSGETHQSSSLCVPKATTFILNVYRVPDLGLLTRQRPNAVRAAVWSAQKMTPFAIAGLCQWIAPSAALPTSLPDSGLSATSCPLAAKNRTPPATIGDVP